MRRGTVIGCGLVAGLVLALVVAGVVAVQRFRTVHPTADELRDVPGAGLLFPGSTVVERRSQDGDRNVMAVNPSSVRTLACVSANPDRVRLWFHAELTRRGWRHSPPGPPPMYDGLVSTLDHWVRGERSFELRTLGPVPAAMRDHGPRLPASCAEAYTTYLQ